MLYARIREDLNALLDVARPCSIILELDRQRKILNYVGLRGSSVGRNCIGLSTVSRGPFSSSGRGLPPFRQPGNRGRKTRGAKANAWRETVCT